MCGRFGQSLEACVVVLVEGSHKAQSGACSALPVGRLKKNARTFVSRNAGIGCHQVIPGEIPGRESSAKLFR